MVYIIGYMGVGKTTLAKLLAKQLQLPFLDTDFEIEQQEKRSITEIFEKEGESYFRKLETKILIQYNSKGVMACGGGLPLFNDNMKYIKKTGVSIYLKSSIDFLFTRLRNEKKVRPLIRKIGDGKLKKFIQTQLKQRKDIYSKATHIVHIEDKTSKEILGEIHSLLGTT